MSSGDVVAWCPWAPVAPFEVWLAAREQAPRFADCSDSMCDALSDAMWGVLVATAAALDGLSYNAVLWTAPAGDVPKGFRWLMRLVPRIDGIAGFELATGCAMHGVPPEVAATVLRARMP